MAAREPIVLSYRPRTILLAALLALIPVVETASAERPPGIVWAVGAVDGNDADPTARCSFMIGEGLYVIFDPKNDFCLRAREQRGRTGTLLFIPDPEHDPAP